MKFLIAMAFATGIAQAATLPPLAVPFPATMLGALIEQDPAIASARATLNAVREDAQLVKSSPYEWTVKAISQRRSIDSGASGKEWNAGLERSFRLPAKANADHQVSEAMADEGLAQYQQAWRDTSRELVNLWLAWLAAEQGLTLATGNFSSAEESLAVVEKRVRSGDASKLDASLARAERAEQEGVANEAKTSAAVARARINARFPSLPEVRTALPTPMPLEQDDVSLAERLRNTSAVMKVADSQQRRAKAQAARLHADRFPDPTVGVFSASEGSGRERIIGVSLSIPIPGTLRDGRAVSAAFSAEMARHESELKKRALDGDIAVAIASVKGAYESWKIAQGGAAAMQENARLLQRAYILGEADIQSMLTARRQATAAAQNSLATQHAAVRAYYSLMIDAGVLLSPEK